MIQSDYYRGHLITTDGKWYIAHHSCTTLRALTRKGIEKLIDAYVVSDTLFDNIDYHFRRTVELLVAEFGLNPTDLEKSKLLIDLKRAHAKYIEITLKK